MSLIPGFRSSKDADKNIIKKTKSKVTVGAKMMSGSNPSGQIQSLIDLANRKLAKYKDMYQIIRTEDELEDYIQGTIEQGYGALDTETTGLDPIDVQIAGLCLYSKNQKPCYIPINHRSYITRIRTSNQLSEEQVAKHLRKCSDVKWVMHNAKFDIRICRHTLGVNLRCFWDTMLAAYCLNENEPHGLKEQHLKYCESLDEEALKIDNLFNGMVFTDIPISTAYLYAAGDPLKTWELFEYQFNQFNLPQNKDLSDLFMKVEMPLIDVVCNMEDRGISLDRTVAENLQSKYGELKKQKVEKIEKCLQVYQDKIENYILSHQNSKISMPVNVNSPTQLAILFYDILKLESPSKKSPRGTGEEILQEFAKGKEKDLCEAILELRGVEKLLSTYIDKMPSITKADGRVHCSFHQYGAKTGRFSSSDPNMQNIPSHNKDIRQMFRAADNHVLISCDYSQQEPMVTAFLSQDRKMLDAFKNHKDIYATIAGLSFHKPYEDCLEFRPDGTKNPAGKERRTQAKSIVLGILYGRQIPSIAEQLRTTTKEAQSIYDAVLRAFPQLADFIRESKNDAIKYGYVTTAWGRRRRLNDMQLPTYDFSLKNGVLPDFDPLDFDQTEVQCSVSESSKKNYISQLDKARSFSAKQSIIQSALNNGIIIKDNVGFIAQAERQCVNARVQGTAADITKIAMIAIDNDKELNELGFRLLLQVHDEVIGECPEENKKKCAERLSYVMSNAPKIKIDLPFRCDCEITKNWYGKEEVS